MHDCHLLWRKIFAQALRLLFTGELFLAVAMLVRKLPQFS